MRLDLEDRIGALHAWWRYHVEPADLDDVWRARWSAYLAAGGSGPALSELARSIRCEIEPDMPAGSLLREGERGDCQAFLTATELWDAESNTPTPMLLTGQRPARPAPQPRPRAAVEPEPAVQTPPTPRKRARRAAAAKSAPVPEPVQSSFDDLRRQFGL